MKEDRHRHLRLTVLVGVLSFLAVWTAAPAQAQSLRGKRRFPPDPKRRYWDEALSPIDYMKAYRATGQAEARAKEAAGSVAATRWTRKGPLGDFPERRYNGRMGAIFLDEYSGGYDVYAGGSSGGLWWARGTTGVPQWTSIGDGLPNPAVHAITINPGNLSDIIVGTGDHRRYGGGGMFRTTDGGLTWNPVSLPDTPAGFFRIVRSPDNPNAMWACSTSGILRSLNWGTTWSVMEGGVCTDMVMDPTDPGVQYAVFYGKGTDGVDNGVYKTDDFWVTSKHIQDSDLPAGVLFERASLAICDGAEDNLALLVETDNDLGGIFKSDDHGETWGRISPFGGLNGFGQIWHAQAIAIRPGNPDDIYAGSVKLWRTVNGGSSWAVVLDYGHADITQLHFDPASGADVLWILNDGGIYKHTINDFFGSTQSWNGSGDTGLNCSQIGDFDAERNMQVIGLQDNGTLQSFDAGNSWNFYVGGDGFAAEIIDSLAQRYWFSDGFWSDPHPTIRIWRKPFGGGRQEAVLPSDGWRDRIFYDRHAGRVYTAGAYGLESSVETGSLGFTVDLPLPPPVPDESNDSRVYGSQLYGDELYITYWEEPKLTIRRKVGGSWTTRTTGNLGTAISVDHVYVSKENPGESWAGLYGWPTWQKILHTTDHWQSWTDITGSLANLVRVKAITVTPMNRKQMFVGTDLGVFRSGDGGTTWVPFQDGLPIVMVTDIYYVPDPNRSGTDRLVVSTYGRGVYSRPISGPPLTYVDPDHVGDEDGMFPHPYDTIEEGVANTPAGGVLALRGREHPVSAPLLINTQMMIRCYDGSAYIGG